MAAFGRLFLALVALLLAFPAFAQSELIEEKLNQFLAEQQVEGAVFWAHLNGTTVEVSVGYADRDKQIETTAQTRFYIASSGKMMTAAAILRHAERGHLQLDGRAWPHIKNLDNIEQLENADQVTIRQLLQHTSGLAEYLTDDFIDESTATPTKRWSPAEALTFAYDEPAAFAPGTDFEYTNTNYVLLGHVLAQLDGSLEQSLEKHIFRNAGMTASTVGANARAKNLAHGYEISGADASQMAWASTLGDGPVVTTAADLGLFLRALFESQSILTPDMLAQMRTGSSSNPSYGLGLGIETDRWGVWLGHSGAYEGYESFERHYPEHDATLVLLINGNPINESYFLGVAADMLFEITSR
ncbi:serine-type D-Ala-D-Ala carboxypeptidase [Maritalea myrionectae]|uniref:Serine-type D-Ala-D-Ala carboxypeptidase n=1 Tax=Maritalea myrionectae TaxID=454601 RepID=A0A2R4MDR4_9HYPH|nr:serine hydrolase domain-containing protein [Maritalea myrionectae]AVX04181.1 serine-type D-Ala-D-Ala carboxypeptidase [Maritalea myrionectae]